MPDTILALLGGATVLTWWGYVHFHALPAYTRRDRDALATAVGVLTKESR